MARRRPRLAGPTGRRSHRPRSANRRVRAPLTLPSRPRQLHGSGGPGRRGFTAAAAASRLLRPRGSRRPRRSDRRRGLVDRRQRGTRAPVRLRPPRPGPAGALRRPQPPATPAPRRPGPAGGGQVVDEGGPAPQVRESGPQLGADLEPPPTLRRAGRRYSHQALRLGHPRRARARRHTGVDRSRRPRGDGPDQRRPGSGGHRDHSHRPLRPWPRPQHVDDGGEYRLGAGRRGAQQHAAAHPSRGRSAGPGHVRSRLASRVRSAANRYAEPVHPGRPLDPGLELDADPGEGGCGETHPPGGSSVANQGPVQISQRPHSAAVGRRGPPAGPASGIPSSFRTRP